MRDEFFVHIRPVPMPRPRFYKGRVISGNPAARRAKKDVEEAARKARVTKREGPVRMTLEFAYRLKTVKDGLKSTKPDLDNLAKLVMDALNDVAYVDDAQVSTLVCRKWVNLVEGIRITIEPDNIDI